MVRLFTYITIIICLSFSCFPAFAQRAENPSKDGSPSQWAIVALEDIFTYGYEEQDEHFKKMKELYFSDQAWSEFQKIMVKARIIEMVTIEKYGVFGVAQKQDIREAVKIINQNYEDDSVSANLLIPLFLIYSGPVSGLNNKRTDMVFIELNISGVKDPIRQYRTDVGSFPSYNYKIESFKVQHRP